MSSITAAGKQLDQEHWDAAAGALNNITDQTVSNHGASPQREGSIHMPASHEKSHTWFKKIFPHASLAEMEASFHMGNYVIDRQTGAKNFEPMSIYVRVGMHLLYYGSEQEKALHWKRTLKLLQDQSEKMGKEYDDPASKAHIVPFIESFPEVKASLPEMVKPDPSEYSTFNEFFGREIQESARPIAEPENVSVLATFKMTSCSQIIGPCSV